MNRRDFLQLTALTGAQVAAAPLSAAESGNSSKGSFPFELEEASIASLQVAMKSGRETAVSITKKYLRRIEEIDKAGPSLRSVIEVNPDALSIARELDNERKAKGPRGALHGIPVLLKDNIDTHDRIMTTAGSFALVGTVRTQDAFLVKRLRDAGAVILGKTNLSEWANFRGEHSSSGWSARGGQTKNPYALDRNPSGSSSGSAVAVAANLCAVAVGTETDGSIISPSALCGVVGIKPTVGLISRSGIIPISRSQDTAGPIARSVRDAAVLLSALAGVDPNDDATAGSDKTSRRDYTEFLDPKGLSGARVGVARRFFRSSAISAKLTDAAIYQLQVLGAEVIDLPEDINRGNVGEWEVLQYEFKDGINAYLAKLGPDAPVKSLQDLIEFNERNRDREMPFFQQETFLKAQAKGPLTEPAYLEALARCRRLSRDEGIDAVIGKYRLDAIIGPAGGPAGLTDLIYGDRDSGGSCCSPAAVAGYPNITVPAGLIHGLPVGICFFGRAYSEPTLLKLAFAFEQGSSARRPPRFYPTIA